MDYMLGHVQYLCVCVLPDSDVRMNVSWENSGGDQAVSGVMKEKIAGIFGSLRLRMTGYGVMVLSQCLFQAFTLL